MNLSDEEVQEERDDGAPIEVLEQYFEARGWACERSGEGEIVASATGSWTQYELRGVWRPEDQVLQFLAFPDIKSTPEKRSAIYESLGLINEQLWLGHFEMWSGSGHPRIGSLRAPQQTGGLYLLSGLPSEAPA